MNRRFRQFVMAWRLLIVIIISFILVPFFLKQRSNDAFYLTTICSSLVGYFLILLISFGMKRGKIRRYIEHTSHTLLAGLILLTATFLMYAYGSPLWASLLITVAAILYASFLQRISFVKVIFL